MAKRILLINSVCWLEGYPTGHLLRDVGYWFLRWFRREKDLEWTVFSSEGLIPLELVQQADGVIMSGSPKDAWADDKVNQNLADVIHTCQDHEVPFLGVCFGHQLLGRVLGGDVGRHPGGLQLGNTHVNLSKEGQNHSLFQGMPADFKVLLSHADAVRTLPPGCELMASSEHTPVQAFHWNNLLFGVQFHPEFDPEVLRFIWSRRMETWQAKVPFSLKDRMDGLLPAQQTDRILTNFSQQIVT